VRAELSSYLRDSVLVDGLCADCLSFFIIHNHTCWVQGPLSEENSHSWYSGSLKSVKHAINSSKHIVAMWTLSVRYHAYTGYCMTKDYIRPYGT
jgi:hypothetical protein